MEQTRHGIAKEAGNGVPLELQSNVDASLQGTGHIKVVRVTQACEVRCPTQKCLVRS